VFLVTLVKTTNMIIKRIGVSCLKVSVARINQYVNTKLDVCWFFKPGACTNQVVH